MVLEYFGFVVTMAILVILEEFCVMQGADIVVLHFTRAGNNYFLF